MITRVSSVSQHASCILCIDVKKITELVRDKEGRAEVSN